MAGLHALALDPRFATNALRVEHRAETVALVRAAMRAKTRDAWIALFNQAGIPCSPLHSLGELSEHPHTRASGMVYEFESERLGTMKSVAQPVRFNGERTTMRRPPPAHGEHSREILHDLGLDEAQIDALVAEGIVTSLPGRTT